MSEGAQKAASAAQSDATALVPVKAKAGNPAFRPTPDQIRDVDAWARAGLTTPEMAALLGIHPRTVERHFAPVLLKARAQVKATIGAKMITKALGGDHDAQKFYLSTLGGWRKTADVTMRDVTPPARFDTSKLTTEQKRDLLPLLKDMLTEAENGEFVEVPDGQAGER